MVKAILKAFIFIYFKGHDESLADLDGKFQIKFLFICLMNFSHFVGSTLNILI